MWSAATPDKEQLIESIRCDLLAQSTEYSANLISKFFTNQRHGAGWRQAFTELFVNADEACNLHASFSSDNVPTIKLTLLEDAICLVVECAQAAGFEPSDVQAICAMGNSAKPSVCGVWRGFGFRSVAELSHSPEIHSNGFHFGFQLDEKQPLSCLLPLWLGEASCSRWSSPALIGCNTGVCIVLPLRPEVAAALTQSGGLAAAIDPRWLLCASNLRRLVVNDAATGFWQSSELVIPVGSNGTEGVIMSLECDTQGRELSSRERWIFVGTEDDLQLALPAAPETLVDSGGCFVAPAAGLPMLRGCGLRFLVCSPAGQLRIDSARQQLLSSLISPENLYLFTVRLPRLFADHAVTWPFDGPEAAAELRAYIAAIPLERELSEPGLATEIHRLLACSNWLPSDAGPSDGLHPPSRLLLDVPDAVREAASVRLRCEFLPAYLERGDCGGFSGHRGRELATCLGMRRYQPEAVIEPLLADLRDRAPELGSADFGLLGHLINELCCDTRRAADPVDVDGIVQDDPVELLCRLPCLPCRCYGDSSNGLRMMKPDSGGAAAILLPDCSELPCLKLAAAALEPQSMASIFVLCPEFLAAQSGLARVRLRHCLVTNLGVLNSAALPGYLTSRAVLPLLQAHVGSRCSTDADARQLALLTRWLVEASVTSDLRTYLRHAPLLTADLRVMQPGVGSHHRLYFPATYNAATRVFLLAESAAPEFNNWLAVHPTAYLQAGLNASDWRRFFVDSFGVAESASFNELSALIAKGASVAARTALLRFLAADWPAVKSSLPLAELRTLLSQLREATWIPRACCSSADSRASAASASEAYRPAELFADSNRARQLLAGTPALLLNKPDVSTDGYGNIACDDFFRDIGIVMDARDSAALRHLLVSSVGLPVARFSKAASVRIYRVLAADCPEDCPIADASSTPIVVPNHAEGRLECRRPGELLWSDLVSPELKTAPSWGSVRPRLQLVHLSICYPPDMRRFFVEVCGVPTGPLPLDQLASILMLAGELRSVDLAWRVISAMADAAEAASLVQRLQALRLLHTCACLPRAGGGFCALKDAPILLSSEPMSSGVDLDVGAAAEAALALAAAHPGQLRLIDASDRGSNAVRCLCNFFKLPSPGLALEVGLVDPSATALAPPQWLVEQLNSALSAALAWLSEAHPIVHRALLNSAAGLPNGRVLGVAELPSLQLIYRLRSRPNVSVVAPVYETLAPVSAQPDRAVCIVDAYVSSALRSLKDRTTVDSVCRRLAARLLARLLSYVVAQDPALQTTELAEYRRHLLTAAWPETSPPTVMDDRLRRKCFYLAAVQPSDAALSV